MTADVELPPCPFCGAKLHEHEHSFVHPHPSPAHGFCLIAGLSFRRDQLDFWSRRTPDAKDAEIEALRAKLAHNRCNRGHETLPLVLWDCPECHENTRARLADAEARADRLAEELRYVLLQNECGMVLTGDEIRKARAAQAAASPACPQDNLMEGR